MTVFEHLFLVVISDRGLELNRDKTLDEASFQLPINCDSIEIEVFLEDGIRVPQLFLRQRRRGQQIILHGAAERGSLGQGKEGLERGQRLQISLTEIITRSFPLAHHGGGGGSRRPPSLDHFGFQLGSGVFEGGFRL